MKKTVGAIALGLGLAFGSGCANLTIRPMSDYNNGPYYCTETVGKMIEKGWNGGDFVTRAFLPVLVLDWPFDALGDTLMFPWDAFWYSRRVSRH